MAEGKKKKTATVRTRVVSADTAPSTKKKKTAKTSVKNAPKTVSAAPEKNVAASSATPKAEKKPTKRTKKAAASNKTADQQKKVGYFKGAWIELKQVRWPNRKATWSLTLAVLVFTAFFVVLVLLVDAVFKYLFDLIIQ
ncbi:MAG: preprotein translocase subunit SecE [Candidatus Saccharimonadales bacterium]